MRGPVLYYAACCTHYSYEYHIYITVLSVGFSMLVFRGVVHCMVMRTCKRTPWGTSSPHTPRGGYVLGVRTPVYQY